MERRIMGKTNMNVSVLGFGGAEIGFENASEKTVDQLLGSALDAGLNVIDTAECYKTSEELIGKVLSHRRDEYYLFTKCGHASGLGLPDWDPKMLEQSIDRSLKRLKTDYVDLLQLHSCSEEILRQGDVIEVLQKAKKAGKTRFIGYSGDRNDAYYAVLTDAFDTLQTSINIADQQAIQLTLPEARKRNMGVIAKRPVANVCWKSKDAPADPYHTTYWNRLQELKYPFLEGDLQESVKIALKFTLAQEGLHTAIVGTANPNRWTQNASLLDGALDAEIVSSIRQRWQEVAPAEWVGQE